MEYNRLVSSTFTILNQESRDMPSSIKSETEPLTWDCYEDRKINLEFPIKREVNIEPNLSTNDREVEIEPSGGSHIQDQALAFYVKEEFELPLTSNRIQPLEINLKFPQMSEPVRQKQDTDFNNLIVAKVETMSSSSDSCEGNIPLYSTDIDIFDCDIKAEDTNRLQTSNHSYVCLYACTVCCMSFRLKRELKTHAKIHPEKEVPSSNSELLYSQTRNLTRQASIQKKISCSVCDKCFSNKCLLTKHMSKHKEEITFSSVCEKRVSHKSHLKVHKLTNSGDKFSCSVCDKSFSWKFNLKKHMLTHSGEKKFSCTVCEKCFSQKCNLYAHMLTHSGEKKFSCSVCEKCFSHKGNLKVHMSTHSGENKFSCPVCKKRFLQKSYLNEHMLTHSGEKKFSCSVCEKCFTRKRTLISHMLIHSGEKPFFCSVCEKCFSHKNNLNVHMLTHSGEKKFFCLVSKNVSR